MCQIATNEVAYAKLMFVRFAETKLIEIYHYDNRKRHTQWWNSINKHGCRDTLIKWYCMVFEYTNVAFCNSGNTDLKRCCNYRKFEIYSWLMKNLSSQAFGICLFLIRILNRIMKRKF